MATRLLLQQGSLLLSLVLSKGHLLGIILLFLDDFLLFLLNGSLLSFHFGGSVFDLLGIDGLLLGVLRSGINGLLSLALDSAPVALAVTALWRSTSASAGAIAAVVRVPGLAPLTFEAVLSAVVVELLLGNEGGLSLSALDALGDNHALSALLSAGCTSASASAATAVLATLGPWAVFTSLSPGAVLALTLLSGAADVATFALLARSAFVASLTLNSWASLVALSLLSRRSVTLLSGRAVTSASATSATALASAELASVTATAASVTATVASVAASATSASTLRFLSSDAVEIAHRLLVTLGNRGSGSLLLLGGSLGGHLLGSGFGGSSGGHCSLLVIVGECRE